MAVEKEVAQISETQSGHIEGPRTEPIGEGYGILLLVTQPGGSLEKIGLTEYTKWFLDALGIDADRLQSVNVTDEPFPSTVPQSGVIIGGSTHSAYENLPWIQSLKEFIRAMVEQNKPILGVCFGHQAIVEALGGKVERGEKGREFGTTEILLTEDGKNDLLFKDLPAKFKLATSHSDAAKALPQAQDVRILGNNQMYPYQSLSIGENVRTLQPHPEITCDILTAIALARKDALIKEGFVQDDRSFEEFLKSVQETEIETNGKKILRNFDKHYVAPYHLGIKT